MDSLWERYDRYASIAARLGETVLPPEQWAGDRAEEMFDEAVTTAEGMEAMGLFEDEGHLFDKLDLTCVMCGWNDARMMEQIYAGASTRCSAQR
jgi:hypothetical protein